MTMTEQNILETVQTRMQQIREEQKAADIARGMQHDARIHLQEANEKAKQAAASMSVKEYEKAQEEKKKAETAFAMYSDKLEQIRNQEYISEEDSDKIIDSLLTYEEELANDFRSELKMLLQDLNTMLCDYKNRVQNVERTITEWTTDIHANYNTRGRTYTTDPDTGITTDRSKTPVPVHAMPYTGCDEAAQLDKYLRQAMS